MRQVAPNEVTSWLRKAVSASPGRGYTGFDIEVWEADTWILNAMYECEVSLPDISADELRKQRLLAGEAMPLIVNGVNLDERTTTTGLSVGRSQAPRSGWRRLRWSELAYREDAPMATSGVPPCFHWFEYRSWPIQIRPFAAGSLDRESFLRLSQTLSDQPGMTPTTRIWCYYSPLAVADSDLVKPIALAASLSELPEIYDFPEVIASPTNVWPDDRSWFVYSDYDLSGTRVSGSEALVASIVADPELETISYP
jgi:hypothetical protein